ncbi:hypothetical protein FE257_011834 [Aspergillus nanangensis]|uniref:Uncharacterized protein n=1 Tax=Aspergillus nanangensis TaxID=2582783 RepID=A0AAD4CX94_ASPNN|nr:hypothetical protein FE257_011834 [Aspergillus nanangensis]
MSSAIEKKRIIGAGLPRTGTTSLAAALDRLRYGPVIHAHKEDESKPYANLLAAKRKYPDADAVELEKLTEVSLESLVSPFNVTLDSPPADFYAELADLYPHSLVILTVRDTEEQWWASWYSTLGPYFDRGWQAKLRQAVIWASPRFIPRFEMMLNYTSLWRSSSAAFPSIDIRMTLNHTLCEEGFHAKDVNDLDLRPQEEIIAQLQTFTPVSSERNLWAFWDTGFSSMRPWTQRNVINWARRDGKRWTVRVLDMVPGSPNNIEHFVDPENLPAAVREGRMTGKHSGQHTSDFVRLALLYQTPLEDPTVPYQVAGMAMGDQGQVGSFFIAARKLNPLIYRWLRVFIEVWGDRTRATDAHQHPLISHLGLIKSTIPEFAGVSDWASVTDYLITFWVRKRVRLNREPGPGGFDGPSYFSKHVLLLNGHNESHRSLRLGGAEVVRLLALPRTPALSSGENNIDDMKSGHELVYGMLAGSSIWLTWCKLVAMNVLKSLHTLIAFI